MMDPTSFEQEMTQERRARLLAERLLEQKERELRAANRKLSAHALTLSCQVIDQRQTVEVLRSQSSQASQDLKIATEKAVSIERLMWAALESMRDGFAVFDSNHRLIAANENYLSITEGAEAIVSGSDFEDILDFCLDEGVFDLQGEDENAWFDRMLARWSTPKISPVTLQFYNQRFIRLVDRHTSEGGIVSLALDITDTIKREQDLREARDRARAADRAKSTFLAKMSHELRTPMNGVVGMADLLIEQETDTEKRLFAETIKSSGDALLGIINDILDFSKLEADRLSLVPVDFDLEKLLKEVEMIVAPTVAKKGIDFHIDYDQFLPTAFKADAGRLRQVITNLVGNAVKFTSQGHVLIRVLGVPSHDGTTCDLTITVEDTGIGIDGDKVDHIFGEFNQVEDEANRKFEGTGLGLAISRGLIERMGGTVWIDSVKGQGSCFGFQISLPTVDFEKAKTPRQVLAFDRGLIIGAAALDQQKLTRQLQNIGLQVASFDELADVPETQLNDPKTVSFIDIKLRDEVAVSDRIVWLADDCTDRVAGPSIGKPFLAFSLLSIIDQLGAERNVDKQKTMVPLTVLAAEDNKTNQLVFKKMVKDLNIDLIMVGNGREAVEAFQSHKPDLVFMDISMPEMDGLEATQKIREMEEAGSCRRVPIVALTAHALDGDKDRILKAGLDHYVTKPIKKQTLHDQIAEIAGRKSLRLRTEAPD